MSLDDFIANGHARRGGRVENYFCILKRRQIYKNFALVARFNRPVNDQTLLFAALRALVLRYPILAASIVTTDRSDLSKPLPEHDYVKVMDTLTLDQVLFEVPANIRKLGSKQEQLEQLNQIDWKYGDETPLWKVGFLDDNTLVILFNHVCSDGISGKNFIQELQNLFNTVDPVDLSTPNNGYLLNYVADGKTLPHLPPPIDQEVDYNPPWSFYAVYSWNLAVIMSMCTTGVVNHREDSHSYRIINIPSTTLDELRSVLKTKKVTLSPYFNSAWLQAFQETLLSNTWFKLTDFSVPCDSRQFIPAGIDVDQYKFGANTGGNHFYYHPVKKHTWSSVEYFNNFFQWCKNQRNFLFGLGFITSGFIENNTNLDKVIQDATVGAKRTGTVMSNIGVVAPVVEGSKYEVEDVLFAKNSGGTQFSFSIGVITTRKGGLNIVVTMAEGVTSQKNFDKLVNKFESNILSFVN